MMKTCMSAVLGAVILSGAALAQTGERCGLIAEGEDRPVPLIGVNVSERAQTPGGFSIRTPADMTVTGIACSRDSAVPAEHDYSIVLAGYALYLSGPSEDGGTLRTLLDVVDEQFRLRVIEGEMSAAERDLATRRIKGYYAAVGDPAS
jgi:hypothetical protein